MALQDIVVKVKYIQKHKLKFLALFSLLIIFALSFSSTVPKVYAACPAPVINAGGVASHSAYCCGDGLNGDGGPIYTGIDLGCRGQGGPITDLTFAIIRLLSAGVGILVVGSIVVAGIQYTMARDNPQNVEAAVNRIRTSLIALLIFIFAYAILNYLVPGGLFT